MTSGCRLSALVACVLILLTGSILHTLAGYSNFNFGRPLIAAHGWGNDDAYISYRYAENFAHGNGLVFNRAEKVEGYSNLLYVLLMSLPFFATANRDVAYIFSVVLNLLFITLALLVFRGHVRNQLGDRSAIIGSFLFVLCPSMWVAVASGMETSLVILLQLAIWATVERAKEDQNPKSMGVLSAAMILSILVRADGFIVPAMAILYLLLKGRFRVALYSALPAALALAGLFVWRLHYYGYFFPNTYYVKVAGRIWDRIRYFAWELLAVAIFNGLVAYLLVIFFLTVWALWRIRREPSHLRSRIQFDLIFAGAWLLYLGYIGGDNFYDRFFLILFPLGIFLLLKSAGAVLQREAFLWPLVLVAGLQLIPLATDPRFSYTLRKYDCWITLGKHLGGLYRGQTLAIDAAGKVPYFSGLATIDMLGINDERIAHRPVAAAVFYPGHNKYDPDYIFSRKPDLIAAWIRSNHDLQWGLTKQKYDQAGYHLKYLVNALKEPLPTDILDVSQRDEAFISGAIKQGYQYAVLEKTR